jgi:hypothetical protein
MTVAKAKHGLFLATLLFVLSQFVWPAYAYVRAVTELGTPVWWRSPCITMDIYLGSPPPTLTADQYWNASKLAARAWSHNDLACTGLSISVTKEPGVTADVGFDQKNVIVFRTDTWCAQSSSDELAPKQCYQANAMAVTTLFKNKTTGEIVDADMEINAVNFTWADLVAQPTLATGNTVDFQNTLTHELGHVIGLAHNCYTPNDGPAPLMDNTGNPEVACAGASAAVTEATMYPAVPTSDTDRRTLSPDDQKAACEIYPNTEASCVSFLGGGGCAVGGAKPTAPSRAWAVGLMSCLALAFAAVAFLRSRISRKRRPIAD